MASLGPTLPMPQAIRKLAHQRQSAEKARQKSVQNARNQGLYDSLQDALYDVNILDDHARRERLHHVHVCLNEGAQANAPILVGRRKVFPLSLWVDAPTQNVRMLNDVLQALVWNDVSLHQKDSQDNTWLHRVAQRAQRTTDVAKIEALLQNGMTDDVGVTNTDHQTVLDLAILNGAPIETRMAMVQALMIGGAVPRDLHTSTLKALVEQHDADGFDLAIVTRRRPVQDRGLAYDLWSCLMDTLKTMKAGQTVESLLSMAERLMEHGAHPADLPKTSTILDERNDLASPLALALRNAPANKPLPLTLLRRLKTLGCNEATGEVFPLHHYAAHARANHLWVLHQEGFDLSVLNQHGQSLLHEACSVRLREQPNNARKLVSTVDHLLRAGADPNRLNPKTGDTPLLQLLGHRTLPLNVMLATVKTLLAGGADSSLPSLGQEILGSPTQRHAGEALLVRLLYPDNHNALDRSDRYAFRTARPENQGVLLTLVNTLIAHGMPVQPWTLVSGMPLLAGVMDLTVAQALVSAMPKGWALISATQFLNALGQESMMGEAQRWEVVERLMDMGITPQIWDQARRSHDASAAWSQIEPTQLGQRWHQRIEACVLHDAGMEGLEHSPSTIPRPRL